MCQVLGPLTAALLGIAAAGDPYYDDLAIHIALARFPDRATVQHWCDYGEKHLTWIERNRDFCAVTEDRERWQWYWTSCHRALEEWKMLKNAQNNWFTLGYRYDELEALRVELGPLCFYHGYIPPPVALHWLHED